MSSAAAQRPENLRTRLPPSRDSHRTGRLATPPTWRQAPAAVPARFTSAAIRFSNLSLVIQSPISVLAYVGYKSVSAVARKKRRCPHFSENVPPGFRLIRTRYECFWMYSTDSILPSVLRQPPTPLFPARPAYYTIRVIRPGSLSCRRSADSLVGRNHGRMACARVVSRRLARRLPPGNRVRAVSFRCRSWPVVSGGAPDTVHPATRVDGV